MFNKQVSLLSVKTFVVLAIISLIPIVGCVGCVIALALLVNYAMRRVDSDLPRSVTFLALVLVVCLSLGMGFAYYSIFTHVESGEADSKAQNTEVSPIQSMTSSELLETLSAANGSRFYDESETAIIAGEEVETDSEITFVAPNHGFCVVNYANERIASDDQLAQAQKEISDEAQSGTYAFAFYVLETGYASIYYENFALLGGTSDTYAQRDYQMREYLQAGFPEKSITAHVMTIGTRNYAALTVVPEDSAFGTCQVFVPGTDGTSAILTFVSKNNTQANILAQHFYDIPAGAGSPNGGVYN